LTKNVFVYTSFVMARPKKTATNRRDNILQIRLTDKERKALDDAARAKALDTSAWARTRLLELAREILEEKSK
jgi:hypothetical protein